MRAPVWFRPFVVAPALLVTLIGLYVWRPVLGLMALAALGGFVVAQGRGRTRLTR